MLALCHSSDLLYQDYHPVYEGKDSSRGLKAKELETLKLDIQELMSMKPDIKCVIDKDRYIYDTKEMPHIAYDIDEL